MVDHSFGDDLAEISGKRFQPHRDGDPAARLNWPALGALTFCIASWLLIVAAVQTLL